VAWVTAGREIENYIPPEALAKVLDPATVPILDAFQEIETVLAANAEVAARFKKSKVAFADEVCPLLTREMLAQHLDIAKKLEQVVAKIKQWNSIP
jgi:hypothetical protein